MSRGHRGDIFEEMINISNETYKHKEIALVQKISTPMKPIRNGARIVSAYYEEKSTLDFIGICKGIPIAFDAKETKEENRFPLSNIQKHQVEFMKNWEKHGGISFLVIHFKKLDRIFRLDYKELSKKWNLYQKNRGKRGFGSITIAELEKIGMEVKSKNGILIDYLDAM